MPKISQLINVEQLLQYLDDDREWIQLVAPNDAWDHFAEFPADSRLLEPFLKFKIHCLEAISKDIIRISIIDDKEEK